VPDASCLRRAGRRPRLGGTGSAASPRSLVATVQRVTDGDSVTVLAGEREGAGQIILRKLRTL
jgi:hypothetical protein